MGRKPTPQPLTLAKSNTGSLDGAADGGQTSAETAARGVSPADSSRSPISQRSSPCASRFAPNRSQTEKSPPPPADDSDRQTPRAQQSQSQSHRQQQLSSRDNASEATTDPPVSSVPEPSRGARPSQPAIQNPATEGKRPAKSGFFHFNKSSKGSNQLLLSAVQARPPSREPASAGRNEAPVTKHGDSPYGHDSLRKPSTPIPSRSELSLSSVGDHDAAVIPSPGKRSKSKTFTLLGRSRSAREEKEQGSPQSSPVPLPAAPTKTDLYDNPQPLRTAPVAQDRAFRDMMNSATRNRSEDRALSRDTASVGDNAGERDQRAMSSLMREHGGSTFFSGLRSSSTKAADMISKGLFGKSSRGGSVAEKEPMIDDEHYVLKVINLPLVEQTRLTRISKRLENSRDKTEFWMPAFPWRAIDYLNYKGCDVEGLYRVPGSGPQIKKWQRRFDEQYDVNLFEADDLYDINIIGSMLKAWLRQLPDELFPKEAQDRIARECAGSTEVPQMLVDELSKLSPFNYYLLFAITCHLSLLLAHSDKNKMDFRNLCICFQPCMKIDAFCFRFLVCDWRECWKGCKNEAKYIEEEYMLFDQPPPRGLSEPQQPMQIDGAEAAQFSSPDSRQLSTSGSGDRTGQSKKHRHQLSGSSLHSHASSISTNVSAQQDHNGADRSRDLRPLSPIKPLSPIGF